MGLRHARERQFPGGNIPARYGSRFCTTWFSLQYPRNKTLHKWGSGMLASGNFPVAIYPLATARGTVLRGFRYNTRGIKHFINGAPACSRAAISRWQYTRSLRLAVLYYVVFVTILAE